MTRTLSCEIASKEYEARMRKQAASASTQDRIALVRGALELVVKGFADNPCGLANCRTCSAKPRQRNLFGDHVSTREPGSNGQKAPSMGVA